MLSHNRYTRTQSEMKAHLEAGREARKGKREAEQADAVAKLRSFQASMRAGLSLPAALVRIRLNVQSLKCSSCWPSCGSPRRPCMLC